MIRTILFTTLLAAGVAHAEPGPHGPGPGGGPPPGAPSPEALAGVPGLDATQQIEIRRILIQRRDAHDALRTKEIAEREAEMTHSRAEHERIDDESAARLRKLLGDDGYRSFAEWIAPREHGNGPPRPPMPRGGKGPGPGPSVGSIDPPAPAPLAPDADAADDEARAR